MHVIFVSWPSGTAPISNVALTAACQTMSVDLYLRDQQRFRSKCIHYSYWPSAELSTQRLQIHASCRVYHVYHYLAAVHLNASRHASFYTAKSQIGSVRAHSLHESRDRTGTGGRPWSVSQFWISRRCETRVLRGLFPLRTS